MEVSTSTPGSAARRNEDIALDLLKFVATTAGVGRKEKWRHHRFHRARLA